MNARNADARLEDAIHSAYDALINAPTGTAKRCACDLLRELIAQRSRQQIAHMERAWRLRR